MGAARTINALLSSNYRGGKNAHQSDAQSGRRGTGHAIGIKAARKRDRGQLTESVPPINTNMIQFVLVRSQLFNHQRSFNTLPSVLNEITVKPESVFKDIILQKNIKFKLLDIRYSLFQIICWTLWVWSTSLLLVGPGGGGQRLWARHHICSWNPWPGNTFQSLKAFWSVSWLFALIPGGKKKNWDQSLFGPFQFVEVEAT